MRCILNDLMEHFCERLASKRSSGEAVGVPPIHETPHELSLNTSHSLLPYLHKNFHVFISVRL